MKRLVILMYHALYADDEELAGIDPPDRPYAVSVAAFQAQLDCLAAAGIAIVDPSRLTSDREVPPGVVLTFDDGHASGFEHALPVLASRGIAAAFFVTTDFIEARPGYCRWPQLNELAAQGMTIGAHGRTHRFFDDLAPAEAAAEFEHSRCRIEQHLGREVAQMSFPGGRFGPGQIALGERAGYRVFHSSRIGAERPRTIGSGAVLCRIPVRRAMPLTQFRRLARAEAVPLLRLGLMSQAKHLARRALGNRLYHGLYERLSS